ncbi:MAG: hypothetical protein R3302_05580, partial [Sulfurimonadaceae bacterium]|nr:hypothetical protein [Sulfurimonadaceae bacterium]
MKLMRISLSLCTLLALSATADDTLEELKLLKQQFKLLQERIEALETKALLKAKETEEENQTPVVAIPEQPVAEHKGIMELTSADTVFSFGGRVRLDVTYGWPESLSVPETDGEDGQLAGVCPCSSKLLPATEFRPMRRSRRSSSNSSSR